MCVCLQEWCRLRGAQEELKAREAEWKKERSFLQEQLNGVREELHRANLRVLPPNLSSHEPFHISQKWKLYSWVNYYSGEWKL